MNKLLSIVVMLFMCIHLNAMPNEPELVPGRAAWLEHTLLPIWSNLKHDKPLMEPLEEVRLNFDRTIKFFNDKKVTVECEGKVVAESVGYDIYNEKDINGFPSTLLIRFNKALLPLGKKYELCLPEGLVGWTECYNDIQILNQKHEMSFFTPSDLGEPEVYIGTSASTSDEIGSIVFNHPTAVVNDAKFILYQEGEKIGEYSPEIINFEGLSSYVKPDFGEEAIIFEKDVRYSIELPAGSVGGIYRSDIVNRPIKVDFIGYYTDPTLPFSYVWCSRYTDHSDTMGKVTFTYDRPIALTENAKVQLWEGPGCCETLVKEVTPWIDTDVNCWLLVADFGGIPLTSENGYMLVIPEGALISTNEIGVKSGRSALSIGGSSGMDNVAVEKSHTEYPIYDLYGRRVYNPIRGSMYICNGKKFIYR